MGTGNGDAVSFGNRRQATGTHFVSGSVASNLAGWVGLLVSVPFSEKKTDTNNTICQRSIPDPYSSGPGGLRGLLPWAPANSLFRTNRVEQQRQRPRRYSRYTS